MGERLWLVDSDDVDTGHWGGEEVEVTGVLDYNEHGRADVNEDDDDDDGGDVRS